jgi:hypothetical protein
VRTVSTAAFLLALAAAPRARAEDLPSPADALVERLLDAPIDAPERRAALEAQVVDLGEAGLAALDRAAQDADPQRAWLAEAYATRARVPEVPNFRALSPRLREDLSARRRSDAVVRLLTGPDVPADPGARFTRVDDALLLAQMSEPRALPWLESFCDDDRVPRHPRVWCAVALTSARRPRSFARYERALDAFDAGDVPLPQPPPGMLEGVVEGADTEALPFLLRLRAKKERRIGSHAATVEGWIERLRDAPGGREALDETLVLVRRFEAEAPPLLHSTGALVEGGWQARRGRDRVEHMVYGPYVNDLPREPLLARFRFRVDDDRPAPDEPWLLLEATSPQGERAGWPIRRREVRREGTPLGVLVERDVWFDPYEEGSQVELRVRWLGRADATVDRVDVLRVRERRASDRAAAPPPAPRPWRPAERLARE